MPEVRELACQAGGLQCELALEPPGGLGRARGETLESRWAELLLCGAGERAVGADEAEDCNGADCAKFHRGCDCENAAAFFLEYVQRV